MEKLSVTICGSDIKPTFIHQQNNLVYLKYFSISYKNPLMVFHRNELLYLLRRMVNLEELSLNFIISSGLIIDGTILTKYCRNQIPRLHKFTFCIYSKIIVNHLRQLPSNEDIKRTFENYPNNQIVSSIDYFSQRNEFYCHIYSYPYIWTSYHNITNNFPGGLFKSVREISLHDVHPFEHDFFSRIAESFPFVQKITLHNVEGQKNNVEFPEVKFINLIQIGFVDAHYDYINEFLNDKKIFLFNDIHLYADYDSLEKATSNFTTDGTTVNCLKVIRLTLRKKMTNIDENFQKYFRFAEISS